MIDAATLQIVDTALGASALLILVNVRASIARLERNERRTVRRVKRLEVHNGLTEPEHA